MISLSVKIDWVERRDLNRKELSRLWRINLQGSFGKTLWCRYCEHAGPVEFWPPFIRIKKWSFGVKCPKCSRASNVVGLLNEQLLTAMATR